MATILRHNLNIPSSAGINFNALALNIITHSTISAEDAMIEVSLSSLLFGKSHPSDCSWAILTRV